MATEIYTLSLHDALPISRSMDWDRLFERFNSCVDFPASCAWRELIAHYPDAKVRSEEHTSELQSLTNLVCRLLLEKKKLAMEQLLYIMQLFELDWILTGA